MAGWVSKDGAGGMRGEERGRGEYRQTDRQYKWTNREVKQNLHSFRTHTFGFVETKPNG
jgi:hypothetical protein